MLRHLSLVWVLACCNAVATAAEPLIWVEAEAAAKAATRGQCRTEQRQSRRALRRQVDLQLFP